MTTIEKINKYYKHGSYASKHAEQVYKLLKVITNNKTIQTAGYYHDLLEDTDVTLSEIQKLFGDGVAMLVFELTKTGPNEFKNLKSRDAIMIKFADRLSNISNLPFPHDPNPQNFLDKSVFWKV